MLTQDLAWCVHAPALVQGPLDKVLPPADIAAHLGLLLCSSTGLALPSVCPEFNIRLMADKPPQPHTKKGSRFLLQLLYWAERKDDSNENKRRRLTECSPATDCCGYITSIVDA